MKVKSPWKFCEADYILLSQVLKVQGSANTQASKFSQMPGRTNHVNLRQNNNNNSGGKYDCEMCQLVRAPFVNISMSLPAQSCGQQEEEGQATRPLYAARALLNQVWLGWALPTRPGQARMDSPMSEVPGTQTTVSPETHRACLRQSLPSQSNPTDSYVSCSESRVEQSWQPSTWLFFILALNFLTLH